MHAVDQGGLLLGEVRVGLGMSLLLVMPSIVCGRVKTHFLILFHPSDHHRRNHKENCLQGFRNIQKMIVKKWGNTPPKNEKYFPAMPKKRPFSKTEGPSISWRSWKFHFRIRHYRNTLETFRQNLYTIKVPSKHTSKFGWVPQGSQRKKEHLLGGQHYNLCDWLR